MKGGYITSAQEDVEDQSSVRQRVSRYRVLTLHRASVGSPSPTKVRIQNVIISTVSMAELTVLADIGSRGVRESFVEQGDGGVVQLALHRALGYLTDISEGSHEEPFTVVNGALVEDSVDDATNCLLGIGGDGASRNDSLQVADDIVEFRLRRVSRFSRGLDFMVVIAVWGKWELALNGVEKIGPFLSQ